MPPVFVGISKLGFVLGTVLLGFNIWGGACGITARVGRAFGTMRGLAAAAALAAENDGGTGLKAGMMFPLTVPSLKALVDTRVRVFGYLFAGKLLLHSRHSCTERVSPAAAFRLGRLQVHALFFG